MQKSIPPLTRREILKLLSLGAGAWIFASCSPAPGELPTSTPSSTDLPPTPTNEGEIELIQPTSAPEPTAEAVPVGMPDLPEVFEAVRITAIDRFYEQSYNGFPQLGDFDRHVN
jgi:hypothetical protein